MLHSDAGGTIAAHGVAYQAAAGALWNRAVVCVNVFDHVVRNETLEVARGHGTRIHGAVVDGLRVGQDDDHLLRAFCKRAFDCLRHMNLVTPLLGADGVAVQGIDHRVAAMLVFAVTRRQEDDHVTVDRVSLEIAFESCAVDLDLLNRDGLCAGDNVGNVRLHLRREPRSRRDGKRDCECKEPLLCFHLDPLENLATVRLL